MKRKCERCGNKGKGLRTISLFTGETLCADCFKEEQDLVDEMKRQKIDVVQFLNCGFVPKLEEIS